MSTVVVATGNRGKLALVQARFRPHALGVRGEDPGTAEDSADVDYEAAVLAKLRAVSSRFPSVAVVALDSGFEFEALGWRPGPGTKRWLSDGGWDSASLRPGSAVRVVHWVAASLGGEEFVTSGSDLRTVRAGRETPLAGDLPLTDRFEGPVTALDAALDRTADWLLVRGTVPR